MISFFSSWIEQIIIAIIIVVVFEMLIPHTMNKKYIEMILGVFVIYVIINPLLRDSRKIDFNNEIKTIIDIENTNTILHKDVDLVNSTVEEFYDENLEENIKSDLEEKGYKIIVNKLDIENMEIANLEISIIEKIEKKENENQKEENIIQEIRIEKIDTIKRADEENNSSIEDYEKQNTEILQYISNAYGIPKENIKIVRN